MDYLEHTAMRHAMSDELYHHGILGQKWGVRRYQNPDGTLTSAGKKRYSSLSSSNEKLEGKIAKENANIEKHYKRMPKRYFTDIGKYRQEKAIRKIEVSNKKIREYEEQKNKNNAEMDDLNTKKVDAKAIAKEIQKTETGRSVTDFASIKESALNSTEVQESLKAFKDFYKNSEKLESKYYEPKIKEKYVSLATKNWDKIKKNDPTADDPEEYAFILYMNDAYKGGMKQYVSDRNNVYSNTEKSLETFAKNILGKYADLPASNSQENKETVSQILSRGMMIDWALMDKLKS